MFPTQQWQSGNSDDTQLLTQISYLLKQVNSKLAEGFQGNGGWTDGGATIALTTITDSVGIGTASPTHTLTVESQIEAGLKVTAEVDTGKTVTIEVSDDLLGSGIKGLGFNYTPGGTANYNLIAADIGGVEAIQMTYSDGTAEHGIVITADDAGMFVNNGATVPDVIIACFDPDGVKVQGKDTGAVNNALTVYDGNDVDFGGNVLFSVRNDGALFTGASQGASGTFTAQSGETVTVTNGLIVSIV